MLPSRQDVRPDSPSRRPSGTPTGVRSSRSALVATAAAHARRSESPSQRASLMRAAARATELDGDTRPADLESLFLREASPSQTLDSPRALSQASTPSRVRVNEAGWPIPLDVKPGSECDPLHFKADESVNIWGNAEDPHSLKQPSSLSELLRIIGRAATSSDLQTASYWAYHMARFSFFAAQTNAAQYIYTAVSKLSTVIPLSGLSNLTVPPKLEDLPLGGYTSDFESKATQELWDAYGTWAQDLAWIKAGVYKMPWDMVTPNKQYNPLAVAQQVFELAPLGIQLTSRKLSGTTEPVWQQGKMYPQYYTKTFHYQTDGWMSSRSASVYEISTEIIFQGRQDAMQRSALVPISDYIRSRNTPLASMRLLEVAAGTGRFHTFIKDNWPELPTVCSDLSPFYLQQARSNMQEWKRMRQPTKRLGGVDDTGVEYVQMAAERLDMPDASVDIVVCVYLFHELPEAIRRKAVAEMYRVLKPGGLCVFADCIQRGDRTDMDEIIHEHGELNEPYQVQYVTTDLGAMFKEAGFEPQTKYLSSVTKALSFIKPLKKPYDNNSPYFQ